MPIHILSPEVASQIAAGEVIERPASVVKELVENALDANATSIQIEVLGAGTQRISVSDNGVGIPPDELSLAVERHATSKLLQAEDLRHISTLGFRGEALASIGSVSRMTITSRIERSEAGRRLAVEGGKVGVLEITGSPLGTLVIVEDLFYNVPARRKFLKNEATERRRIETLAAYYALANPSVRFSLQVEKRQALQTSGNGNQREILGNLLGPEIARQLIAVSSEDPDIQIFGFTSPISLTRSNRREIIFFVNGRPVQDPALFSAFMAAYRSLIMVGRYPLGVLFITLPPEEVDVNVHPAKAEVRFQKPDRIYSALQRAVRRALLAHSALPDLNIPLQWTGNLNGQHQKHSTKPGWEFQSVFTGPERASPSDLASESQTSQVSGPLLDYNKLQDLASETQALPAPLLSQPGKQERPLLRPIGQLASTYIAAEGPDGLYLIDQHAAHERILFEKYLAQRENRVPSQALLQPTVVELTSASAQLLSEHLSVLGKLGFRIEWFGSSSFIVRSIPVLLAQADPVASLRALVEDFEEDETPLQSEIETRLIARICKRAAVKAGQPLTPEEQHRLIEDLAACQAPRTCPHGRPTMIHLSVDLLERQFGRRGAR